jgi:hypothetical protein
MRLLIFRKFLDSFRACLAREKVPASPKASPKIIALAVIGLAETAAVSTASAGTVDLVPYYEPDSPWVNSVAGKAMVDGMFAQFESILRTSGAWNCDIEVYLTDDETSAYGSAEPGNSVFVTINGKQHSAVNAWAQIVQGLSDPNGPINPSTGANADIYVHWNFSYNVDNPGLLRHELLHALGMISLIEDFMPTKSLAGTITYPPGPIYSSSVHDTRIVVNANGDRFLASYHATNPNYPYWPYYDAPVYQADNDWDDDNGSGLAFLGISDLGTGMNLPLTSWNPGAGYEGGVDPHHSNIVSYSGYHPTWNTLAEVDRAYLRGLGYSLVDVVSFSSPSYSGNEGNVEIVIPVSRLSDNGSTGIVSVNYSVSGNNTGVGDFSHTAGVVTFPSGISAKNIVIPIVDDSFYEGAETFQITLSIPPGPATAIVGNQSSATITILDNDTAAPRPDVVVGASRSATTGSEIYTPIVQLVSAKSKKARPVTASAQVFNRGNLVDTMTLSGTRGKSPFRVTYFGNSRNLTAAFARGSYRVPNMDPSDPPFSIQVSVAPDKRKLAKKGGKRIRYKRLKFTSSIRAASGFDSAMSDLASIRVQTK